MDGVDETKLMAQPQAAAGVAPGVAIEAPPGSDARFFARYRRIMLLTFGAVLTAGAGLLYIEFSQRLDAEISLLEQRMVERRGAVNALMRSGVDYVAGLQLTANTYYETTPLPDEPSPLAAALFTSEKDGMLNLDRIPAPYTEDMIGNLTAPARPVDDLFWHEIEMALSLNPLFTVVRQNIPNAAWVYYTSKNKFINIEPWVKSETFKFTEDLYTHEFYTLGLPEANPGRQLFWTEPYRDEAGKGLMVTAAAPVYQGEEFRGTVAIDFTLDVLTNFVMAFRHPHGTLFVVNERNQVLAHPRLSNPATAQVIALDSVLPEELRPHADTLVQRGTGRLIEAEGYVLYSAPLDDAPWHLVFVSPKLGIQIDVLESTGFGVAALLLGLTALIWVATRTTRKEFIVPAQRLVSHIEAESHGRSTGVPDDVPGSWRPWFDAITRTFNAHSELVSIRQELDVARRMQQSILPTRFPDRPDFKLYARMTPAKEIGGDFYDFFWLDERRLGVVIADVSGKGVPAALFMAVSRTLLRATAPASPLPGDCVAATNDLLAQDNDAAMFVTLFYGVLDITTGELAYANAGHNPPYILRAGGELEMLPGTGGMAVGIMDGMDYSEATVRLSPGDDLFLFTDGVTEAINARDEEFGTPLLEETLRSGMGMNVRGVVDHVVQQVERFADGTPQADDITCLCLRWNGAAGSAAGA